MSAGRAGGCLPGRWSLAPGGFVPEAERLVVLAGVLDGVELGAGTGGSPGGWPGWTRRRR